MKYEAIYWDADRWILWDVATGLGVRDDRGVMLHFPSKAAAIASIERLWDGDWHSPDPQDVFFYLDAFGKPEVVYICGSGAHLKDGLPRIPIDAFTIALNSVIVLKRPWSVHLCADQYAAQFDWFQQVLPHGCIPVYCVAVLDYAQRLGKTYPQGYTFESTPMVTSGHTLLAGRLQVGGTVAGCALRFAYEIGAKRAVLCGVDMHGRGHFDGAPIDVKRKLNADEAWEHTSCLQWICDFLSSKGLRITTLTETMLELPKE